MTIEGVLKAVTNAVSSIELVTARGRYDRFEREIPKFAADLVRWERLGPEDADAVKAHVQEIRVRMQMEADAERSPASRGA